MAPKADFPWSEAQLRKRTLTAVKRYWGARSAQASKQITGGAKDAGSRGEVTGGQHLDAFCELLCDVIRASGFEDGDLRFRTGVEVPGFYRPTKKWDIVVQRNGRLCAAIEMKSQVGPSFGNNFNNRTEEAVGSSIDLWRAYKEGVLGTIQPWLGYFFFLESTAGSTTPVGLAKSTFPPDPIFVGSSYAKRYEILCRRMMLERNYNSATLLLSPRGAGGAFSEPARDLGLMPFAKALYGHLLGCG